ncbi:MAG: acyl-CoA dehydrogenase [Rhodospirillaceae bacterium]|jgi:alkylation response protein AidB-like acyl-CoA dehydrogenase|nr:acyl-CoA dehydrogenase [Rhodospirillaceae bacterium]MBT5565241.1 acyl-CoA dehydrogenase [Rhodospirillaceae bacterium]MBT6091099.1 acyl-CoA dehydrogenase [Rhodospirillaceae bacterium]
MPTYTAPIRDMRFVVHELFGAADTLTALPGYEEASADLIDAVLEECGKLCEGVLAPINQSGDEEGCRFDDGAVTTPTGFKEAYKQFAEGGWCGLTASPEYGGQGLPETLQYLIDEMVGSANLSFGLYPGLTQGTIICLSAHGTDEQKQTYIPRLVSGEWQGTMCLTEPHAGSDLGLLRAKAAPNGDGTYAITGTKIFISAGEHDMTDNFVHLVLARLPDAPEGSRGISMFLVPKFLVNDDGSLGERNAAAAGSIEHKMGMKASVTCVMNFDGAKGWLIGKEHKGLAGMFTMMNKERLFVGTQGISQAETAYQNATAYAKDRIQGRAAGGAKQPDKAADSILVHPDIRNKLLFSKSIIEAERALAVWTQLNVDIAHAHGDDTVRERAGDMEALMTPIIKSACTDFGTEITNACLQVFGGHGYISEWGMEQLVRDVRITQIYEGTNTIQALDLVGRKLGLHDGRLFDGLLDEINQSLTAAEGRNDLAEFVVPFKDAVERLKATTDWLRAQANDDPDALGAAANDYLRMFALTVFAWMWVRMAEKALDASTTGDEFYETKLQVGRYFMTRVLPGTVSLEAVIKSGAVPMMALSQDAF